MLSKTFKISDLRKRHSKTKLVRYGFTKSQLRKDKDFLGKYSPPASGSRGESRGPGAGAAAVQGGPGGRQEGDAGGQHEDEAESRHQTRVREDGGVRQDTRAQETQDLMTKHANADT